MKKLIYIALSIAFLIQGCEDESPMDTNLYPQKVYIVGTADQIIDRDLHIGKSVDTISISVAVGGSLPTDQEVTVTIEEVPTAVEDYNEKSLSPEEVQYRNLGDTVHSYLNKNTTIEAGKVYNTYPIQIKPETLHCDSLYMIALTLTSTSAYELPEEDTVALVRLNLTNDYAGLYYMEGFITNTEDTSDFIAYKMARNLVATDDGSTVRLIHFNNETVDYRPSHGLKISVNEADTTLSFSSWDEFEIYDGGGLYYPSLEVYSLWYEFNDNGTRRRTEGFLYKERETEEAQRIIDDWIEEQEGK